MTLMAAKHVVLLGGAGGIGRALVKRLLAEGARVSVLDLAGSLTRYPAPAGVASFVVDATDPATLQAAAEKLGPIDGFVNLAGFVIETRMLTQTPIAEFDATIAGNLRAAFLAAQAFAPLISPGGAFVNTASGLAANHRAGYGAYAASKAAIISFTKTLALELAPTVRVNCVAPGAVDTAFLRGGTGRSDEARRASIDTEAYAKIVPLARMATVDDVVGPYLFLLSDMSRFMTGQVLWVNGGQYMP